MMWLLIDVAVGTTCDAGDPVACEQLQMDWARRAAWAVANGDPPPFWFPSVYQAIDLQRDLVSGGTDTARCAQVPAPACATQPRQPSPMYTHAITSGWNRPTRAERERSIKSWKGLGFVGTDARALLGWRWHAADGSMIDQSCLGGALKNRARAPSELQVQWLDANDDVFEATLSLAALPAAEWVYIDVPAGKKVPPAPLTFRLSDGTPVPALPLVVGYALGACRTVDWTNFDGGVSVPSDTQGTTWAHPMSHIRPVERTSAVAPNPGTDLGPLPLPPKPPKGKKWAAGRWLGRSDVVLDLGKDLDLSAPGVVALPDGYLVHAGDTFVIHVNHQGVLRRFARELVPPPLTGRVGAVRWLAGTHKIQGGTPTPADEQALSAEVEGAMARGRVGALGDDLVWRAARDLAQADGLIRPLERLERFGASCGLPRDENGKPPASALLIRAHSYNLRKVDRHAVGETGLPVYISRVGKDPLDTAWIQLMDSKLPFTSSSLVMHCRDDRSVWVGESTDLPMLRKASEPP